MFIHFYFFFFGSLTKGKNDEELNVSVSKHFEQWGSLLNVKVLKDWMGRPYAFVQFEVNLYNQMNKNPFFYLVFFLH